MRALDDLSCTDLSGVENDTDFLQSRQSGGDSENAPAYVCIDEQRFERLMRDLDGARRGNARKSLAMAAAGHDLRQRLQTIVLALDLATHSDDDPVSTNWLDVAKDQILQLATGLKQLAIQAEVDGNETSPPLTRFPIDPLLQRIERNWRTIATYKRLQLLVVPCGALVRSNVDLLESIIDNLVGNAIKHTGAGTILIDCTVKEGRVRISVSDTGPGIAEHDLGRIFDPFWRGATNNGGMGLGLTIVRRAAELLSHEITIGSLVGQGSCFSVDVPQAEHGMDDSEARSDRPRSSAGTLSKGNVAALRPRAKTQRSANVG